MRARNTVSDASSEARRLSFASSISTAAAARGFYERFVGFARGGNGRFEPFQFRAIKTDLIAQIRGTHCRIRQFERAVCIGKSLLQLRDAACRLRIFGLDRRHVRACRVELLTLARHRRFQFHRGLFVLQRQRELSLADFQRLREPLNAALQFRSRICALLRKHGLLLVKFPRPFALGIFEGLLLRGKPCDVFIELFALPVQIVTLGDQRGERGFGFRERPRGFLRARGQQLPKLALHGGDQRIFARRFAATGQLRQRIAQILRRVTRRVTHVLRAALLHPQQTRNARVFRLQRPARGTRKTEQCGELVFRFVFTEYGLADLQLTALTRDELLRQAARNAVEIEAHFDRRLPARLAPRQQFLQMRGFVAFEKHRTHGLGNRALAGLVRSHEKIEAGLQVVDKKTSGELFEFLYRDTLKLHADLASRGNSR